MEAVYNALADMDMEGIYLMKACGCGSTLSITNGDVFNLVPDQDGGIYLRCPCCGAGIKLYKYWGGKKYSLGQYAECAGCFEEDVWGLIKGLSDINMGHGEGYSVKP